MELVNEWLPTVKYRKVDTTFSTDSTYENELMAALPLAGNPSIRQKWNVIVNLNILLEGYSTFLL